MNQPISPRHVPTLTEVVEVPASTAAPLAGVLDLSDPPAPAPNLAPVDDIVPAYLRAASPGMATQSSALTQANILSAPGQGNTALKPPVTPPVEKHDDHSVEAELQANIDQLTQRVLTDVQRQIDLLLEYRLREVLAPILARATDGIIKDSRKEMTTTLKDIITRAVAQELLRHRQR